MREIILIAHISLDGFVANKQGALDDFESGEDNLAFVTEICKEADTVLLGRKTYELLDAYWPHAAKNPGATKAEISYSNWYNTTRKIVISRTVTHLDKENTIVLNEAFIQRVKNIRKKKGKPIVIFGSPSMATQLMEHDLIDTYWIFMNPVIFGGGISFFTKAGKKKKLRMSHARQFANDELALKYTLAV